MRAAAFVQLGRIGLHPAPNTAGMHLDTTLGHQLGDVQVGEGIPEIPAHAQDDHFSRELAPLERIERIDRHRLLPYQNAGSKVRNGTVPLLCSSAAYHQSYSRPDSLVRSRRPRRLL